MPLLTPLLGAALAAASPAVLTCAPMPGWDRVLAHDKVRWIVIGELHGTAETPAIFADAVCLTAQQRGPVVVALEMPSSDQGTIDAFIASDGGAAAQAAFLKMWFWQSGDGRSSKAFFRLFDRLRQMHHAGTVKRVVAFQDDRPDRDQPGDQGPYEMRLAAIVHDAATPGATVLALVGNLHARKTEVDPGQRPFMPMASHLPAGETLTLNALGNGGTAWNCIGPTTPPACGAHPDHGSLAPARRGVALQPVDGGAYDGVLNLGTETTASPPERN